MGHAFDDPFEIVLLGFEFPDRRGDVRRHQFLFAVFFDNGDLHVAVGIGRHFVFERIRVFRSSSVTSAMMPHTRSPGEGLTLPKPDLHWEDHLQN